MGFLAVAPEEVFCRVAQKIGDPILKILISPIAIYIIGDRPKGLPQLQGEGSHSFSPHLEKAFYVVRLFVGHIFFCIILIHCVNMLSKCFNILCKSPPGRVWPGNLPPESRNRSPGVCSGTVLLLVILACLFI